MSPRFPPDSPTLNACQLVPAVGSHQFLDILSHVLGGSLKIHLSKKGAYCSWRELFPSPPGIIYVYKLFNVILFDFWPWKQGDQLLPMEWPLICVISISVKQTNIQQVSQGYLVENPWSQVSNSFLSNHEYDYICILPATQKSLGAKNLTPIIPATNKSTLNTWTFHSFWESHFVWSEVIDLSVLMFKKTTGQKYL